MAEREGMIGEFLKFFPGSKPKEKETTKAVDEKLDIQDEHRVIKLVELALLNENPVQMQIPGENTMFFTRFSTDDKGDLDNFSKGVCLVVQPLDPPVGNIKVRFAPSVKLNFFTDLYIVEAQVRFERIREDRTIQLSFPKRLVQGPQKRNHERVKVDPKLEFILEVVRPSGLSFRANVMDLSVGGLCFCAPEDVARLEEGMKLGFILECRLHPVVNVSGLLLGKFTRERDSCYRVKFLIKTKETMQQLQTLLLAIAQDRAARRDRMFKG